MWLLNKTKILLFSLFSALGVSATASHSAQNKPCEKYALINFSKYDKRVWVCTEKNNKIEFVSPIAYEVSNSNGRVVYSVRGTGVIIYENTKIEAAETDVLVNMIAMGDFENLAIDRDGNIIFGGFIRGFD